MGADSKIEWTTHTFNPWVGCEKVSPGCEHCYAEGWAKRSGIVHWGRFADRRRTSASNWNQPVKWNRDAAEAGTRPRVFCASLADWLDVSARGIWRADLLNLIEATPNLDWLLLSKRIGGWNARMHEAMAAGSNLAWRWLNGEAPANVWLGTTVEDQKRADERIPELLEIPAVVRFLSMEPLLGPVEFSNVTNRADAVAQLGKKALDGIDWVICGGESGPKARPMHPQWARSLRDQCAAAGVPFLFKQWGEFVDLRDMPAETQPDHSRAHTFADGRIVYRVGKHDAGRLLDGQEWNEYPETGGVP